MKLIFDWLDDRSGYRNLLRAALDEEIPGGASFAYVFGSVLSFVLVVQMITGVFLAMHYSPSATDAWASVAYIQDQVTLGWLIRGLHAHGASAMVILAGLHLLQTAVYGAYKKPRELNWIVGVLMLGLILAFALTGYLLPWDQTGYWATKVATGIAGTSPVVGPGLQEIVQGGNEYGNLTITRFFAIHVFLLPGALIAMLVVHVGLFRRHGVTPKWGKQEQALAKSKQLFWPDQMFKDMVAIVVVFGVVVGTTIATHGAPLGAPADPASNFDARPEWYFRPLFQLLKYFEGPLETAVSLGAPVVIGGALLVLPFVDRAPDRHPKRRLKYLSIVLVLLVGASLLTAISFREDAADPALQKRLAASRNSAQKARMLAKKYGVPAAGGRAVFTTEPFYRARKIWREQCASCHVGDDRKAPVIGPGYNSRAWIRAFLANPSGEEFFGPTKAIREMKPVVVAKPEMDALVEFVYAESGAKDINQALAAKGQTLFDDGDCSDCHERDGTSESSPGPNLGKRGTARWFRDLIADAGDPRLFGAINEMPKFHEKLSEPELQELAEWLVLLRNAAHPMD